MVYFTRVIVNSSNATKLTRVLYTYYICILYNVLNMVLNKKRENMFVYVIIAAPMEQLSTVIN